MVVQYLDMMLVLTNDKMMLGRCFLSLLFVITVAALQAAKGDALRGPVVAQEEARELQSLRIVGGRNTTFEDFPFFVYLESCGASLIWEDVVLTGTYIHAYMHMLTKDPCPCPADGSKLLFLGVSEEGCLGVLFM
jgi:hypothetical protein